MRTPRTRAWPIGFVGALVIVVVLESAFGHRARDLCTVWVAAWARAADVAPVQGPKHQVLFLGDSLVMQGIVPRVVAAESGFSAYNLAVFKGLAPASYVLLNRAVEAGARPRAVVIDGELLCDDPAELVQLWPTLLEFGDLIAFAMTTLDAPLALEIAIGKSLPSMRFRYEIRNVIEAALEGRPAPSRRAHSSHVRNWERNAGANVVAGQPVDFAETLNSPAFGSYWPTTWRCHPINNTYIERFLALADARSIPVIWLMPPVHPEVQRRRDGGGLSAQYEQFVRDLQTRHPRLLVFDARHSGFPESAMADLTHLNRDGAIALSAIVGRALRDVARPNRGAESMTTWIRSSRYSEAPREYAGVEDLGQSNTLLREAARERAARTR